MLPNAIQITVFWLVQVSALLVFFVSPFRWAFLALWAASHFVRALGFSRARIVTAFLAESIALALIGGVIGCLFAIPVNGLSTGAMNMVSFTELAFKFRVTPALIGGGIIFSAAMGAVGGLLPALRAARIPVARALREI